VKECSFDIFEAFTPPPVGNFTLKDARDAWGEKVTIWINFPESIFYEVIIKLRSIQSISLRVIHAQTSLSA